MLGVYACIDHYCGDDREKIGSNRQLKMFDEKKLVHRL
jgi:hypothetical protein